jgi:hypothetical protein
MEKNMRTHRLITGKEFELIKSMQNAGVRTGQIIDIVHRPYSTIGRIKHANSIEEYRKTNLEKQYYYQQKRSDAKENKEYKEENAVQTQHDSEEIILLKEMRDILIKLLARTEGKMVGSNPIRSWLTRT